jgi:hypothetical protein
VIGVGGTDSRRAHPHGVVFADEVLNLNTVVVSLTGRTLDSL